MKKYLVCIGLILIVLEIKGQHIVPMHTHWIRKTEGLFVETNSMQHTGIRPYVLPDTSKVFKKLYKREGNPTNWVDRKLRYENLLLVENKDIRLTADLLFHFEGLKNTSIDELFYRNTRGVYVSGRIGRNVAFYSMLHENQMAYQPYINEFIENRGVIPFGANYKPYEAPISSLFKNGYDYSLVEGVVSWNAFPVLNVQLGQARNFIGEGYRSLLLSDNGYSYPFVKATFSYAKIQYSSLYAEMMDFDQPNSAESGYHKKRFGMHYLSFRINNSIQIGLFESIVYNPEDSIGYNGFKPNYVNPLILSRSAEYGLNGKNNVMLGLVWRIDIVPKLQHYGQILWDEFGKHAQQNRNSIDNKTGFQLGIKWFDALTIPKLYAQAEYNRVRPYTYGSMKSTQNFVHARQAIAHPKDANFQELVGILNYRLHDFELELQGNVLQYGVDSTNKTASNILLPQEQTSETTSAATFLQGAKNQLAYGHAQISYLLNPSTDMRIYAAMGYRKQWNAETNAKDLFVFFGLRTFLTNNLFDF